MTTRQRFSHVAITVPRALFLEERRAELLDFYGQVFGWSENPGLSIPDERIFLRAPSDAQYLTIRAADAPMETSGYEHLGVLLASRDDVRDTHARAAKLAERLDGVTLEPVSERYDGKLLTFRVRYSLPLTIEVQHFATDGS